MALHEVAPMGGTHSIFISSPHVDTGGPGDVVGVIVVVSTGIVLLSCWVGGSVVGVVCVLLSCWVGGSVVGVVCVLLSCWVGGSVVGVVCGLEIGEGVPLVMTKLNDSLSSHSLPSSSTTLISQPSKARPQLLKRSLPTT